MKPSRSPLERKRPLLLAVGLLLACSFTLLSFEWRIPYSQSVYELTAPDNSEEPIWIPVTLPEPARKMERPEPPKKILSETFEVRDEPIEEGIEKTMEITQDDFVDGQQIGFEEEEDVPDENLEPLDWVSVMPEYCGGEAARNRFLSDHLEYPEVPRKNGITGVVYVQFVVGKDGRLRDAKVIRSVDRWLDAEALRVTKLLDCFTPGMQGGRPVDVYFRLPVRFSLR